MINYTLLYQSPFFRICVFLLIPFTLFGRSPTATMHSTTIGGNWTDPATCIENRAPVPSDEFGSFVEIWREGKITGPSFFNNADVNKINVLEGMGKTISNSYTLKKQLF